MKGDPSKKRKAPSGGSALAASSSSSSGSSSSGKSAEPKKKRAYTLPPVALDSGFTRQAAGGIGVGVAPTAKHGTAFVNAIDALKAGGAQSVHTSVRLQIKKDTNPTHNLTVGADYTIIHHEGTGLTQASMHSNNLTGYDAVLPEHLTPQRATLEGRAIKRLAPGGEGYDPAAKLSQIDSLDMNRNGTYPKQTVLGGIALQSHLEDVTAKRAANLDNVGSGIRAKTMAAKWTMNVEETEDAGQNYRSAMYAAFPQLGKSGKTIGALRSTGIAELKRHWEKPASDQVFTKENQLKAIDDAHQSAHKAAIDVFQKKATAAFGDADFDSKGAWWKEKERKFQKAFARIKSDDADERKKGQEKYQALSEQYVQRKLGRHGIKND